MNKIQRRGTTAEILSIPNPSYITTKGRDGREAEQKYVRRCMELLDKEARRYPGCRVKMTVKNGIPYFEVQKRSPKEITLNKRINRTLMRVKKDLRDNKPKSKIIARINSALGRAEAAIWEE